MSTLKPDKGIVGSLAGNNYDNVSIISTDNSTNQKDNHERKYSKDHTVRISNKVEEFVMHSDHYRNNEVSINNAQHQPQHRHSVASDSSGSSKESIDSKFRDGSGSTFRDGSVLTKSMIEPELETYFQTRSSWQSGILIMANVCLGMGILNFPRIVYESGGILPTVIIILVFVLFIIGSLYMTVYCCRYFACVNYQDMVRLHCGRYIGGICTVLLFLEITGSLVVKMVVLQDQLDKFYSLITQDTIVKHWYLMPVVAVLTFLPMCFIRDFSCFKYVSIGGVLAAAYIAIVVAAIGYYKEGPADPILFHPTRNQPRDFNLIFPLLVYGYHGHVEVPLVFASLKKHRITHFMNTVYCYILIATACYLITAIYGYLTFGREADVDFLLNYPTDNWYANIASFIICFKLFTSFPVLFFVDRSVFSGLYTILVHKLPKSKIRLILEHFSVARVIQTLTVFIIIVILAAAIPNIGNAISIIGAVSCHFSFTFPGLCFFCLHERSTIKNPKGIRRKLIGMVYIVIGIFLFGVNLTIAIQELI